jgi:hypothetical protein
MSSGCRSAIRAFVNADESRVIYQIRAAPRGLAKKAAPSDVLSVLYVPGDQPEIEVSCRAHQGLLVYAILEIVEPETEYVPSETPLVAHESVVEVFAVTVVSLVFNAEVPVRYTPILLVPAVNSAV